MKDVLIPLGGLIFIGLITFAMIREGRKQRKAKDSVFRDFADKNGLRYQEQDDKKAQDFSQDLDGIGRFKSPSLGRVIPKDVVYGVMHGSEAILFRHYTRFSEGWAKEWFVAGVISEEILAERCAVQFCKSRADKEKIYLPDPVVKELKVGTFNLVVRAMSPSCAGKIMDDDVLRQLAGLSGNLSFRPEIQVREKRIVAYLADRNAPVVDVETLEDLFKFTNSAVGIVAQMDGQ